MSNPIECEAPKFRTGQLSRQQDHAARNILRVGLDTLAEGASK